MKRQTILLSCLLGLSLAACTDDDDFDGSSPIGDGGATVTPSAQPDASGSTDTDAGTPPVSKAIPLIDWVDDLLDHHTNDESPPDTVDDKNIADNEDPATFDKRFVN